jgi:two-component system NtrC family sensor kinase
MAWSFRPGIRTEIVFVLTVLMAGAVALMGILFLNLEARTLLEQKVKGSRQTMVALQRFLQDLPLERLEGPDGHILSKEMQNAVALFGESQIFSDFLVMNRAFRVVASSRPEQIGTILRDEDLEKALATGRLFAHPEGEEESFSLIKTSLLLFSAPLIIHGETFGVIRGEFSLNDLRETLYRSQALIFLYVLLNAIVLTLLGSFLLSRIIVKPLKKLVQMSEKIAEGDLNLLSESSAGDEIGKLFASFNRMAARLRENRGKVEEYIHSLEKVNRELRRAQDEVIRSEKMASIGRLASGVAHEVGNPTGAILGYLDLLAKGDLPQEEEKGVLQRTLNEAERIRRIVRELLDFSRPSPDTEEDVDVNEVIRNAFSLVSHQRKVWEQIQVITELQPDLPHWKGDPHQLQQVMINLFVNAADAMRSSDPANPDRGRRLRVASRSLGPEEIVDFIESIPQRRKEDSPSLDYSLLRTRYPSEPPFWGKVQAVIRVEVEDTGPGIPKEALGKIFDPYYSTKSLGEGTGLGLAICVRILESYGGQIHGQSGEGKGALFSILLPVFGPSTTETAKIPEKK